jgi:MoaA/NifB/PqqE/SkfB family radical SAM enzyme
MSAMFWRSGLKVGLAQMIKTMNLTDKLFQEFVVERISETSWVSGNKAPLVVELDPTAACDLACPGCISEDVIAIGGRFSNERLLSLGKEFISADVKAVILIGGGEPLAHPKIGEFIKLMGLNDVHIGITTNGTFIHRYLEEISEHAVWTRVSMDAATDKLFSKLRPSKKGKSKFEEIIRNMRELAKSKKGKLGFSFLVQTEADGPGLVSNVHEIYDAAVLAKDIGCDYFEVKPTYQFREDVPHSLMKHAKSEMDAAKKELERVDGLNDENFQIFQAINLKYSLAGIDTDQPKNYKACPSTHLRTTVTPSGVYVCPYWRGKSNMKIGDVNNMSFVDMWNGFKRSEVMHRLDASRDCNFHCLRHETNNQCIDVREQLTQGKSVSLVKEYDRFI